MNDEQSITKLAISVILGIIIVGCVLLPVISDATESYYIKGSYSNVVNDSQISLKPIDQNTSNTLNIDSTGITTAEGVISYWEDSTYINMVLITDTLLVTVSGTGVIATIEATGTATSNITSFTAVISAGALTYSINGSDAVSTTYAKGYVAALNGDYTSTIYSETKYTDSNNFAEGRARSGVYYVYIDGTGYANGVETTSNVTKTPVAGTDNQVSTIDEIKVGGWVMSTVCVVEKTANYRYTEDSGIVALYGAIVPIIMCAIILGVAASIFISRRD